MNFKTKQTRVWKFIIKKVDIAVHMLLFIPKSGLKCTNVGKFLKVAYKEDGDSLHSVMSSSGSRGSVHKQEGPSECFHCDSNQEPAWVALGFCSRYPGRSSKAIWMHSLASRLQAALLQQGNLTRCPPEVPSNLNHSVKIQPHRAK